MTALFNKRKKPIQEAIGQLLLVASIAAAIVYGGGWYPTEWLWPAIVKGSAVGLLAIFVLISMQSINHLLLFLALAASVGGDVLLAIPHVDSFTHCRFFAVTIFLVHD